MFLQYKTWDYTSFFSALPQLKLPDKTLLQLNDESLLTVLLFGSQIYKKKVNVQTVNASVGYLTYSDVFVVSSVLFILILLLYICLVSKNVYMFIKEKLINSG